MFTWIKISGARQIDMYFIEQNFHKFVAIQKSLDFFCDPPISHEKILLPPSFFMPPPPIRKKMIAPL